MKIERFEDIEAWRLAREPTPKVYDLKKQTRFARDSGLKGQIQDAAGSSRHDIAFLLLTFLNLEPLNP